MSSATFLKYIRLLEILDRYGPIKFEEIQDKYGEYYPKRTFRNHIDAIAKLFGIDIRYQHGVGYYIDNPEDLSSSRIKQNIVSSLNTYSTLADGKGVKNRILLEEPPKNQELVSDILDCIQEKCSYGFEYSEEGCDVEVIPYCLKLFKGRWYLLGKDLDDKELKIFALDLMSKAGPLFVNNPAPVEFNPNEYFKNYYGVIAEGEPEIVRLKVSPDEAKHLKLLPIHHSQKEIELTDKYSVFELYIAPTNDFKQDILSRTDQVEILEPASLREWMKEILKKMSNNYK